MRLSAAFSRMDLVLEVGAPILLGAMTYTSFEAYLASGTLAVRLLSRRANGGSAMRGFEAANSFTGESPINASLPYLSSLRSKCPVLREPHYGTLMVTGY